MEMTQYNENKRWDNYYSTVPVIQLYNKYTGVVDRSDQMGQYYESSWQAKKWWRYIMWFCVYVCIVKAHILIIEQTISHI